MQQEQTTYELNSETYGLLKVNANQIFRLPHGIVGLPEYKDYALIPMEDGPYYLFHHLEHDLSFILVEAAAVTNDYDFHIDQNAIEDLKLATPEDVALFLIVNIDEKQVLVNLKAPILLNPQHLLGCQYVITDKDYPIRHPITEVT